MLPSRVDVDDVVRDGSVHVDVIDHFAARLGKLILGAAKRGERDVDFYVPQFVLSLPRYDRTQVVHMMREVLLRRQYHVFLVGKYTLKVCFGQNFPEKKNLTLGGIRLL